MNRQIFATRKTVGQYKVDVAQARILEINPDAVVHTHKNFYSPQTAEQFDFTQYDYVVGAIDTVTGKLALVEQAERAGVPIISSMGAGYKVDPTAFEVADIYETSVCPLARVMRQELRKRGIRRLKVVYSKEPALTPDRRHDDQLPRALHLPARDGAQVHAAQAGARQQCVRSAGCRPDPRRRGRQGSDRLSAEG